MKIYKQEFKNLMMNVRHNYMNIFAIILKLRMLCDHVYLRNSTLTNYSLKTYRRYIIIKVRTNP
jgi:hypothetical protein